MAQASPLSAIRTIVPSDSTSATTLGVDLLGAQRLLDQRPQAAPGAGGDDRDALEVAERDPVVGGRRLRRLADQPQVLRVQRDVVAAVGRPGQVDHGEVHPSLVEELGDVAAHRLEQLQPDPGAVRPGPRQQRGGEVDGGTGRDADGDQPAHLLPVGGRRGEVVELPHQPVGVAVEVEPGPGRPHAARAPLQQVDAQLPLELRHPLAQRRLRDLQLGRRPRQAPGVDHGEEVAQLHDVHGPSPRVTPRRRRRAPSTSASPSPSSARIGRVCSPSAGTGSIRGVPVDRGRAAPAPGPRRPAWPTRCHRSRAASCGCSHTSCIVLTRAYATGTAASARGRLVAGELGEAAGDDRPELLAVVRCGPRWWRTPRGSATARRRRGTRRRTARHSRSFWIAIITTMPSPATNGPYG